MSQTKINVGMIDASSIADTKLLQGDGAWVTPSAAGMSFISNTDISAAATYDFTAFTAGSYEHYQFILQNLIPVTDNVELWCRTSTDATNYDAGGSDYNWGVWSGLADFDVADSEIALTGDDGYTVGSDTNESGISGSIWLFAPHTTSYTHVSAVLAIHSAESGRFSRVTAGGGRLSAADVTGFRCLFSSGNIESGTITAYGLANS
jgi:hypothetical protein